MKKLIKRILLIILAVLIAVQAPFIYRRYKLGQLSQRVQELNSTRTAPAGDSKFKEYKGIIHAHTNLGGHSTGSFDELIAAANANDLDFVIMTEHWSDTIDTAALTLNGVYGKTLFIGGNEIDTADGDRFLMIPGSADAAGLRKLSTADVLAKLHAENRLALVTYPEKFKSWDSNFDGIEVFSLHTNAKKMNPFTAIFDGIWSYPAYPELMLASYFKRPDENLKKFDEITAKRKISLIAGTDAHSNIGFHLFGDDAGNKLLNFKIDDYATIFRLARQHVLIDKDKPLTRENLIEALKAGRSFIGLDVSGDSTGFVFEATRAANTSGEVLRSTFGDVLLSELQLPAKPTSERVIAPSEVGIITPETLLSVRSPISARIALVRNGQEFQVAEASKEMNVKTSEPGAYRVEVYLDQLGPPFDKMPWIISNPIYVR